MLAHFETIMYHLCFSLFFGVDLSWCSFSLCLFHWKLRFFPNRMNWFPQHKTQRLLGSLVVSISTKKQARSSWQCHNMPKICWRILGANRQSSFVWLIDRSDGLRLDEVMMRMIPIKWMSGWFVNQKMLECKKIESGSEDRGGYQMKSTLNKHHCMSKFYKGGCLQGGSSKWIHKTCTPWILYENGIWDTNGHDLQYGISPLAAVLFIFVGSNISRLGVLGVALHAVEPDSRELWKNEATALRRDV